MRTKAIVGGALCALIASSAFAGIADSPVPTLGGEPAKTIYSVTDVMNAGALGTYFSCTSTATAAIQVGVELFDAPGGGPINSASSTALSVAPGQTVVFGTSGVTAFTIDSNLNGALITRGSARIISTSKSLLCHAFVADRTSGPPISMMSLTIVAKTKQKAAN